MDEEKKTEAIPEEKPKENNKIKVAKDVAKKTGENAKAAWEFGGKVKISLRMLVILLVLILGLSIFFPRYFKKAPVLVVETLSTLEKVIKTSSLSTYETVYNGISTVMNEKGDKVLYYVTYEANVKAGLDFDKITIEHDQLGHKILIGLPKITMQEPSVDIESIDYIFVDKHVEKQGLIADAYQICIDDVKEESKKEDAIYQYAKSNAESLITGLVSPFIAQLGDDYVIEFK